MAKLKNLPALLLEQLKDLSSAETQPVKALPAMAKAATDEKLTGIAGALNVEAEFAPA